MQTTSIIHSPIGNLQITTTNDFLIQITFLPKSTALKTPTDKLSKYVESQLNRYFENPNFVFNIPIKIEGTEHQRKVWNALQTIKPGTTKTYGELAKELESSPRAIGSACRTNRLPLIIPCHRIVGKNSLVGFAGETSGEGIFNKSWLLNHEAK